MRYNKRTLTYVAIALIVGVALAFAVALSRTDSSASTLSQTQMAGEGSQNVLADDALAADPARKEPSLDQFTSKDPFVPLDVANNTSTSTSTTNTTNTSGDTTLSAKVKVNGTAYTVSSTDKVPSGDPVFSIASVTSSDVTFKLVGGQFSDGSDTVTVTVGDSVKVINSDNDKSYTLTVTSVGSNTGSGGSSSTNGHSISVLSISSQNGTELVAIKVDGTTYSDKKQGDTFTTSWGEIKILSVSASAQTVTIMHGDATLTLHAGQAVV
jgi:hypothetical protein